MRPLAYITIATMIFFVLCTIAALWFFYREKPILMLFSTPSFKKKDVIFLPSGTKLRVLNDGIKKEDGWEYKVKMIK